MADIDFYDDLDNRGSYGYVSLSEVVNNFMVLKRHDSFVSAVSRDVVIVNAMRGIRELSYDVLREVKTTELDLTDKLTVTLPHDYVNFLRISWVDTNGMLHPLAQNKKLSVAVGYLQDSSGELLFDNNGCVLKTDGTRNTIGTTSSDVSTGAIYCMQFTPNLDLSEIHSQGSYNIDKPNGIIQFSSNAQSKTIVIEYISDSLATECGSVGEPKVNKLAESALMDYIYYELIKNNVNTHANEKARARHEFYQSKKRAGRRINGIKMEDLLQTFKSYGKWN